MALSKADSEKIQKLAKEGKQTKRIFEDYFPYLSYREVAAEVRSWGEKSALGAQRMITRRIDDMAANDNLVERKAIAKELRDLTKKLYNNHKANHDKLTAIRDALYE